MNETVEETIGYAIQVYLRKFQIYHHIVEIYLITFVRVLNNGGTSLCSRIVESLLQRYKACCKGTTTDVGQNG
jgi:predicted glycosyltransferase